MPWYSSWIPTLPNFAIPTSIQGRFLSFILKKALGNFVKPGQLDHHQIDSQIGSGYVQVNDLGLHPEAINGYLEGLPIALHSGTVSSVKARIPWPNPLASTLGFSVKSIYLTFHVVSATLHKDSDGPDLSSSVASVAESFVHEELSGGEEAGLWKSLHEEVTVQSSLVGDQVFPGGLGTNSDQREFATKFETDPVGVSVFAGLVERLLARFEFDAQDIRITLIHPGNMALSLEVEEIKYLTNNALSNPADRGESRSLSLGGLTISCRDLSSPGMTGSKDTISSYTPSQEANTPSLSRVSSRSSVGEAAQFDMSQSILALPPRSPSPLDSVSSSMYESAISTNSSILRPPIVDSINSSPSGHLPEGSGTFLQNVPTLIEDSIDMNQRLLTFGSQPIVLRLTTPPPVPAVSEVDPFLHSEEQNNAATNELEISVSVGMLACLMRPWQIRSISTLATSLVTGSVHLEKDQAMDLPQINVDARIRGVIALLYSSVPGEKVSEKDAVADFFKKPLVPPVLEQGYTRIYLDNISAIFATSRSSESQESMSHRDQKSQKAQVMSLDAKVGDLSVFYFRKDFGSENNGEPLKLIPFPIILTDPYLVSQYPALHEHPRPEHNYHLLPTFNVIDWTDERCKNYGTKVSQWRCQPPKSGAPRNARPTTEPNLFQPFMKVSIIRTSFVRGSKVIQISESMETNVAPLNIRVDIQYLLEQGGPLSFFEDLLPLEPPISDRDSFSSEDTIDMYSSTRNVRATKGAPMNPQFEDPKENSSRNREKPTNIEVKRVVNFPFTRIAVRCPSPQSIDRSGTVILDVHDLALSMNPFPSNKVVNFASDDGILPRTMDALKDNIVCMVEFDRAVIACSVVNSTIAVALASVGPLTDEAEYQNQKDENELRPDSPKYSAFKPCIRVIQPSSKTSSKSPALALSVDIPSVHADISKEILDALQYWADDVSQLLELLSKSPSPDSNSNLGSDSKDTSLIGSRFFVNSRSGSGSLTPTESAESVIKLTVTEAFVRIMVPRSDSTQHSVRPFDVRAADVDVLIELNPDNKQQTVITMGVMDLSMRNTDIVGHVQKFFGLSSPHSLSSTPKPIVKLRFTTSTIATINSKETRIKLTLCNFTYSFFPDLHWTRDLATFGKNPPGTFESVIPSDRTRIFVKIIDGSIQALAPINPASIVSHINELEFATDVIGDSRDSSFQVQATDLSLLVLDDVQAQESLVNTYRGKLLWTAAGYALLAEVANLDMKVVNQLTTLPLWKVSIIHIILRLHLCADTMTAVTAFIQDFGTLFKSPAEVPDPQSPIRNPAIFNKKVVKEGNTLMSSVEDLAFKRIPEIGPAPDMIYDDLPTNMDYLDESFGAAAGLRELRDDDLEDFDNDELVDGTSLEDDPNVISKVGGETIKIFEPQGLEIVEDYFHSIPPDRSQETSYDAKPLFNFKVQEGSFTLLLYDGYDWAKTRKTIEEEVKEMRKRLAKIRQLVASGQTQDPVIEDTSALLFNSVHIGLDQDDDVLKEPSVLIAAIDEELKDEYDTATQSSWQSLRPTIPSKSKQRSARVYGKKLTRSKSPSMEFCLTGMYVEFDQYEQDDPLVSRTFVTVRDLEILDHIKTSTWKKFLTELRSDSRGNVRETDSNMVRIELRNVRPVSGNLSQESRLRAKILPLRLYVDQDAVDFLKKFFSFEDPHSQPNPESSGGNEAYIQLAEIFPIDLKLDYKPRRVDYRALKEGRTIELMNFFHFDGAEMTLRHITLSGVTGWPKMFEMLNDLWTPDVKATQLAEVISGVAPIRSVVNVGSGVADLILLPIAQYKKDGRIVRGIQKGATAFVKSTAVEAIKMGAKLATGTQVILEQAEGILGGQLETITAEPVQISSPKDFDFDEENDDDVDLISKYAQQPADLKEGVQSAYKSLQKNLSSAAQTILAVPMEVYERSGNEGPVRSVIRAVPIAVLKPMIGASEAVSKTLLGLHNTLDPNVRHENNAKYKLR